MKKEEKLKELTLLYVEDDEVVRLGISKFLRRRCKTLLVATNGAEGLETYRQHSPAMVITDIEMPKMNGIVMIEKILELNKELPIIITTGYDDDAHKSEVVCRNILKPIRLDDLLESIFICLKLTDDE